MSDLRERIIQAPTVKAAAHRLLDYWNGDNTAGRVYQHIEAIQFAAAAEVLRVVRERIGNRTYTKMRVYTEPKEVQACYWCDHVGEHDAALCPVAILDSLLSEIESGRPQESDQAGGHVSHGGRSDLEPAAAPQLSHDGTSEKVDK